MVHHLRMLTQFAIIAACAFSEQAHAGPIDEDKRLIRAAHFLATQCDAEILELESEPDQISEQKGCEARNGVYQVLMAHGYFLNKDSEWQKNTRPETPAERRRREFNSKNE